jgi:anti-anti-sigma factor
MSISSVAPSRTAAIRRRLERQYVVVVPPDELDAATVPSFAQRLLTIEPNTDVVVDLGGLDFCGASGLAMFLDVQRALADRDSTLTLSAPPPAFDRLVALCDLGGHLQVRRPTVRRTRSRGGADPARR